MLPNDAEAELRGLAERLCLSVEITLRLGRLAEFLAGDPQTPSAIRDPLAVVRDHLADSLVALRLNAVSSARAMADLGSGAGVPLLPLAICRPELAAVGIESAGRKAAFIARAAAVCDVPNVTVVPRRAEEVTERERFELVTARALAPLEVVAEYAAPLLRIGGTLVAWRGRRDPESEAAAARAAGELGLEIGEVKPVEPYRGVTARHLHLLSKVGPTPERFPRRPGVARKRPLGRGSDRLRR